MAFLGMVWDLRPVPDHIYKPALAAGVKEGKG